MEELACWKLQPNALKVGVLPHPTLLLYACTVVREDAKETETEETIGFFVTFFFIICGISIGGRAGLLPPGYAWGTGS